MLSWLLKLSICICRFIFKPQIATHFQLTTCKILHFSINNINPCYFRWSYKWSIHWNVFKWYNKRWYKRHVQRLHKPYTFWISSASFRKYNHLGICLLWWLYITYSECGSNRNRILWILFRILRWFDYNVEDIRRGISWTCQKSCSEPSILFWNDCSLGNMG